MQLLAPGVGVLRPAGGQVPRRQERRVGGGGVPAARAALPGARPRRRGGRLPDAAGDAVHHPRQRTGRWGAAVTRFNQKCRFFTSHSFIHCLLSEQKATLWFQGAGGKCS